MDKRNIKTRYTLAINPFTDFKASKCLWCNKPTYARKFPLLIIVENTNPLALGFTCKYCSKCELIVAHKKELEEQLYITFKEVDPTAVGKPYKVMGTVDKSKWKKSIGTKSDPLEVYNQTYWFKKTLEVQID